MNYFDLINSQFESSGNSTTVPEQDSGETNTHVESTYSLYEFSIKIRNGTSVSIREVFTVAEIFEDIFSNTIHGYVEVNDMVGGMEKFMFTGGETITITALKPSPSTEILFSRNDLIVHRVSKVEVTQQNSLTYRLFFISKSAIDSQKKRIYRSFRNNLSISNLITKIYKEIGSEGNLELQGETVSLTKTFLCPGYTPYEAIDYLCKRAGSSDKYHLFFERLNTFNGKSHVYGSLDKIKQYWTGAGIPTIYYSPSYNYTTTESLNNGIRANSIEYQSNFDHISNMMGGFYNSRIRMIDPIKKIYSDTDINYKTIKGTDNNVFAANNVFLNYTNSYPEYPGERMVISPTNDAQSRKSQWIKRDTFGMIDMSLIRVNIDIAGGSNKIGAGNLINLSIPSLLARNLNFQASVVGDDLFYSDEYLVTAVRHVLTYRTYSKKIEASKSRLPVTVDNQGQTVESVSGVDAGG